jgi:hypothetical protein
VFTAAHDYVKIIVAEENFAVFNYVTLRGALAKKKLEDKLVEKLPNLISCIAHKMTDAVKASFKPGLSPLRMERFEILCDAICEAYARRAQCCSRAARNSLLKGDGDHRALLYGGDRQEVPWPTSRG